MVLGQLHVITVVAGAVQLGKDVAFGLVLRYPVLPDQRPDVVGAEGVIAPLPQDRYLLVVVSEVVTTEVVETPNEGALRPLVPRVSPPVRIRERRELRIGVRLL